MGFVSDLACNILILYIASHRCLIQISCKASNASFVHGNDLLLVAFGKHFLSTS
jgi:hypothetical protein